MNIGDKFGRWTVLSFDKKVALCRCDCGVVKNVNNQNLKIGSTKSCGCFRSELLTTHGKSRSRAYKAWAGMKDRCYNKNNQYFHVYGGAGISVCERWLTGFDMFYQDMGDPPDGMSIDRINNKGNYEPSNCKWSSGSEQSRNTNHAKLTIEIVRKLRSGELTVKEVMKLTGCVETTARNAKTGKKWKEI
jgi:hypothetical protein